MLRDCLVLIKSSLGVNSYTPSSLLLRSLWRLLVHPSTHTAPPLLSVLLQLSKFSRTSPSPLLQVILPLSPQSPSAPVTFNISLDQCSRHPISPHLMSKVFQLPPHYHIHYWFRPFSQDFCHFVPCVLIRPPLLRCDLQHSPIASHFKRLQLVYVLLTQCPAFTAI